MTELFSQGNASFSDDDVLRVLSRLGIKNGDIICVHSELISLGKPLLAKNEFLDRLVCILKQAVGKDGSILMPTFTYSFCKNEPYDILNSKSTMGALSEHFRCLDGVLRTSDPIFSFAIYGKMAKEFLTPAKTCLGRGSVYDTLARLGGKILLFGTQDKGFTFTHYVEELALVSYRFYKEFKGELIDENGRSNSASILYYVRRLDVPSEGDLKKQISLLKQSDNFKIKFIANAPFVLIDAKRYQDEFLKAILKDESAVRLDE